MLCEQDILLKLSKDKRLAPDLSIICVDNRWCLDLEDADLVAAQMTMFMESLRRQDRGNDTVDDPNFDRLGPPRKKPKPTPIPKARFNAAERIAASRSVNIRASNPHVHMGTRKKIIEPKHGGDPTSVLMHDIARICIEATKLDMGEFVNICYNCTGDTTKYDGGCYVFAMSLKMARDMFDGLETFEATMAQWMQPGRKNPSFSMWIEQWVIEQNAQVDRKCSRVFPVIGHIMNFNEKAFDSAVTLGIDPYLSEQRSEKFSRTWCSGDPREHPQGWFSLSIHNQCGPIKPLKWLNFKKMPFSPDVDKYKWHWLTYVNESRYSILDPGMLATALANGRDRKDFKEINIDGNDDFYLDKVLPFDPDEVNEKGRITKRMKRNRRYVTLDFGMRTFSTNPEHKVRLCFIALCCVQVVSFVCFCILICFLLCVCSFAKLS